MTEKRVLDMLTWERREHFAMFKDFEHPQFSITAPVNVARAVAYAREQGVSIFKMTLYLVMKAVNAIPEFRTRVEEGRVVEFDAVSPAATYMPKSRPGLYSNMLVPYDKDYRRFEAKLTETMEEQERQPTLEGAAARLDVVYVSCIPWVSFSCLLNPIRETRSDSVPRICWGKYAGEGSALNMPVVLQLHHGLADAYHVGLFFALLQNSMNDPKAMGVARA